MGLVVVLTLLKIAYRSLTCEVRLGKMLSDSFAVDRGLRQGCTYPITIIISLYINSLVEKPRGVGVGVECRGRVVAALAHLIPVLMQYGKKRT